MTGFEALLPQILVNLGALVILCIINIVQYRMYLQGRVREDKLLEINSRAISQTEDVIANTKTALANHVRIMENQQALKEAQTRILDQLQQAKEREQLRGQWRGERGGPPG
jgi:hypothetical protein